MESIIFEFYDMYEEYYWVRDVLMDIVMIFWFDVLCVRILCCYEGKYV